MLQKKLHHLLTQYFNFLVDTKTTSPSVLGITKKVFLRNKTTHRKPLPTPKLTNLLDDIEMEEFNISEFATQPTVSLITTSTKSNSKPTLNTKRDVDEIEQYILNTRRHLDTSTNKENKKTDYIDESKKLLDYNRQLQILEMHLAAGTVPFGLKIQVRSTMSLPAELKNEWNATVHSCSNTLLQILIKHHKNNVKKCKENRESLKKEFSSDELNNFNKFCIQQHNESPTLRNNKLKRKNSNQTDFHDTPRTRPFVQQSKGQLNQTSSKNSKKQPPHQRNHNL